MVRSQAWCVDDGASCLTLIHRETQSGETFAKREFFVFVRLCTLSQFYTGVCFDLTYFGIAMGG